MDFSLKKINGHGIDWETRFFDVRVSIFSMSREIGVCALLRLGTTKRITRTSQR